MITLAAALVAAVAVAWLASGLGLADAAWSAGRGDGPRQGTRL